MPAALPAAIAVALLAALAPPAAAQSFERKDWELACDNTRTCRAAGYQRENDANAVTVLLTRKAGPSTAVDGKLQLGYYGDDAPPQPARLVLSIGGRSAGAVAYDGRSGEATLSPAQVGALLKALAGTAEIALAGDARRWRLSGEGAAAVLLKMDDLQGRVGTPGALVRKGRAREAGVLPALPVPTVQAVRIAPASPQDAGLAARLKNELGPGGDDCPELARAEPPPTAWRLDARRLLVSTLCWRGAYNEGVGYWIVNAEPPYDPRRVTSAASDFDPDSGTLSSAQKGRGLGDCWAREEWVWNGREFVHASATTTGLCRLVAPGGAWDLPTLVSDVRPPR